MAYNLSTKFELIEDFRLFELESRDDHKLIPEKVKVLTGVNVFCKKNKFTLVAPTNPVLTEIASTLER
jgi:hypothetical protein